MKLTKIILEQDDLFVPRRSQEERDKTRISALYKQMKEYTKNGSQGELDLHGAPFKSLPKELTYVGGALDLSKSKIETLPEGLVVEDSLFLTSSKIKYLPKGLVVRGGLDLENTVITSLPKDIKVEEYIILISTPLGKKHTGREIKNMYPGIKGFIFR